MTRKQRKVLLFIQSEQDAGRSVTVGEVASAFGALSRSHIHDAMRTLVDLGYLTHIPHRARAYEVVRRIEPIVEHWVWDDEAKALKPFRRKAA